jgi:aminopeptidase YwaD
MCGCRHHMVRYLFAISCLLFSFCANAQDKVFARSVITALTDPSMSGRGYVGKGDHLAAEYISTAYTNIGLTPFGETYMQDFSFSVNTFPGKMEVAFNHGLLVPGVDFQVSAGCPSVRGTFRLLHVDSAFLEGKGNNEFAGYPYKNLVPVIYEYKNKSISAKARLQHIEKTAAGLIYITSSKLTWTVAREVEKRPVIFVRTGCVAPSAVKVKLNIKTRFIRIHETRNVIGYLKGSRYPDSFLVVTAHYDHLGRMGKNTYFPGGNDNASGIAMLLDLAKYYSKNPPEYSIAFMAFAGEEAGLLGSYYYTMAPLFPLERISFLINIDLMGTGENGMTVVNGSVFEAQFAQLVAINKSADYLKIINSRGKAANSDHHHFTEAGVRSFFFYLLGNYTFYHDINDTGEAIKLNEYDDTFRLIRDFIRELQQ